MTRPLILTPELAAEFCAYIAKDNLFPAQAAALCGISATTYYNWTRQARLDRDAGLDTIYVRFLEAVLRAEAESARALMADVKAEAGGAWHILKARFRKLYGDQLVLAGDVDNPIMHQLKPGGYRDLFPSPDGAVDGEVRELTDGDDKVAYRNHPDESNSE